MDFLFDEPNFATLCCRLTSTNFKIIQVIKTNVRKGHRALAPCKPSETIRNERLLYLLCSQMIVLLYLLENLKFTYYWLIVNFIAIILFTVVTKIKHIWFLCLRTQGQKGKGKLRESNEENWFWKLITELWSSSVALMTGR